VALEVAGEPAVAADPGQGALDDPSLGQDDEPVQFGTFDDFELPGAGIGDDLGNRGPLIAGVGEDLPDRREAAAGIAQQTAGTVAVLDAGAVDDDVQQQAEGVDEDVALAARDFLARVVALRVDRRPPFCAARALWLSRIATVGPGSRPDDWRTCAYSA
jgi:hypothetical protein